MVSARMPSSAVMSCFCLMAPASMGNHLVGEPAGVGRRRGPLVRLGGEAVEFLATDAVVLGRDVFGGEAHAPFLECAGQPVVSHVIDHRGVAELHATANTRQMRRRVMFSNPPATTM